MAKASRPRYEPMQEAIKALNKLSVEDLSDKDKCIAELRRHNIKLPATAIGRARAKLMREKGGVTSPASDNPISDFIRYMAVVNKAARAVGGFENLQATIAAMREARGR